MAMEILKEVSADEQLRTRIRFQEKAERDRIARLNSARLDGLEEGMEKGERQKSIEIARNLLDVLDDELIAAKTGLSVEEVAALRAE